MEEKKKFYKKWWFWLILIIIFFIILSGNDTPTQTNINNTDTNNSTTSNTANNNIKLQHGELLDFIENTNVDTNTYYCVIKAKIEPSYSDKTTISQNFFNVEDFIKNQDGKKYDEIQYWAVADFTNGDEEKVISFTINKDTINKIYNSEIPVNILQNYTTDYWVHSSLSN